MRWETVWLDDELSHGQFEVHDLGITYRGPIEQLAVTGRYLRVLHRWRAYKFGTGLDSLIGSWFDWPILVLEVPLIGAIPTRVGHNIVFTVHPGVRCVLIPRDGTMLPWSSVQPVLYCR